ncbi:MAG: hypothetical protein IT366_24595 [Candidatus Hydrogenedentes bacterium]|nr:hypothetical protein [Candidatus Hydrogenedentota bacterium]
MANEISHRHSATGETLYFTIRNTARQMWNTAGTPNFETLTVANWGDYDVALSESPASSYFFAGTFPAISGNMIAGWYWVDVFKRAGGSPAISDALQASYFGYWDGTTFKWWADDTVALAGGVQSATDLKDFADDGYDPSTHKVQGLVLADTVTTLTNDPTGVGTLLTRLSSARAGYLDNLSAGAVALASQILDAAGIRSAVGLANANLDTQIGLVATASKLLKYFQLLLRKDAAIATDNATELTAINANGGSGAGAFANTTDSVEAIRDRNDEVKTDTAGVKLVTDKVDTILELIP